MRTPHVAIVLCLTLLATSAAAASAERSAAAKGKRRAPAPTVTEPIAAPAPREIIVPTLPTGRPDLWDSYMAAQKDHAEQSDRATAAEYGFRSVAEMATWEQQAQAEARTGSARRGSNIVALVVGSPKARITSDYGMRVDPMSDGLGTHAGIDIAAPYGTPIFAVAPGTVTLATYHGGNGFMVELQHADGTRTRYCHASSMLVEKGRVVNAGDKIALIGSTGRSTGAHVHFEVRRDGIPVNPHAAVRAYQRHDDQRVSLEQPKRRSR